MALCARCVYAPQTASDRRTLAATVCLADRRAAEYVSDVGQRTAADTASPARARHDRRIGACEGHRARVARQPGKAGLTADADCVNGVSRGRFR